jgi:hypothetical protein
MRGPSLVGLIGYAGSGKSEVASVLQSVGFSRIKFADPLKDMLRVVGLGHEQIEGRLKNEPSPTLLGKTPRYAMQTLGTEWGRSLIGENFWASIAKARMSDRLDNNVSVVCDDVRFPNEADIIRALGGQIWRVVRLGAGIGTTHESERHIDAIEHDLVITNCGTLDDLRKQVLMTPIIRIERKPCTT